VGIFVAMYGLRPRKRVESDGQQHHVIVLAPEDAPMGSAHWLLMLVLTMALVIVRIPAIVTADSGRS
jgi:putative MFS transporter